MQAQETISVKPIAFAGRQFSLWVDSAQRAPQRQVDMDEWLVENIDSLPYPAVIRIWSNQHCLVVSRRDSQWPEFCNARSKLRQKGYELAKRRTGGTAVLHGPDILNFTLCYRLPDDEPFSVAASYALMNRHLIDYLANLGISASQGQVTRAYCPGRYDIISDGRKVAGTAQRLKRDETGQIVLSHLSLNVGNNLVEQDKVIDEYYRDCNRQFEIAPGLTSSVNSLLQASEQFPTAMHLGDKFAEHLEQAGGKIIN